MLRPVTNVVEREGETMMAPFLLTVKETAELLRIQRPKVYLLIENGTLQAAKVGGDWRVRRDSVESLVGPLPEDFTITRRLRPRLVVNNDE